MERGYGTVIFFFLYEASQESVKFTSFIWYY
jgi:hypothetical protein